MLVLVVGIISLYLLYKWLNQRPPNFPPGPPTVPILGSIPFVESNNYHFYLENARKKYGNVMGFKFGRLWTVAICGVEECSEAYKREDFTNRPDVFTGIRPTEGIFFANGDHWKNQRRFTLRHLRDFGFGKRTVADMIHEEVEQFCEKILAGRKQIEISGLFTTSAVNIIWAMIAGSRLQYGDKDMDSILTCLQQAFRAGNVTGGILLFPRLKNFISLFYDFPIDKMDRALDGIFNKVIDEHLATRGETPRDFLDVYLQELDSPEKRASFRRDTLIEVIRDLFGAGAESSSNTVSFAIMYLLRHPEWQEKLIEEIDKVLQGDTPNRDDLKRLPLVEAFLAEVMRSNTIAPLNVPRSSTRDCEFRGFFIPKDTMIQISIWSVLQDKKHWGDPEKFRPERFLDADGKFFKDPALSLFGGGSRLCIGESLARDFAFLFLVSLLQRYKFSLPKGAPLPDTTCVSGFTTAPRPFFADLTSR